MRAYPHPGSFPTNSPTHEAEPQGTGVDGQEQGFRQLISIFQWLMSQIEPVGTG